jgi:hypothetical protein
MLVLALWSLKESAMALLIAAGIVCAVSLAIDWIRGK